MFFRCSSASALRGYAPVACLVGVSFFFAGCAAYNSQTSAAGPALTVSASSLGFDTIVVGQSATQTLQLTNSGNAPLQISSIALSNKEFAISGPSLPRTVQPATSLLYTLAFAPTTPGNASASLTITSNAPQSPAAVSLAGVAEAAVATLQATPASINFGNENLQSTATQNVTLKNTGDVSITVSGVTAAGAGFGYSNLSPGFSLSPNQQVIFQVWFRPQTSGAVAGSVSILSANLASPETVSLTGNGVSSPQPALTVPASSFNFNTVVVGQSATQTLQLTNSGNAPLQISSIALSNQQFAVSGPSLPRTVQPATSLLYTLAFAPTTPGNASASLTITSNAPQSPAAVSLAGIAEAVVATLQVTPASINFGNENLQSTATQNVTLQNTGDVSITVNGVTAAGAGFGYSNLSPGFSLSPNQQVIFQVWFRPQTSGAALGTVSILSANLASPETVSLTGNGVSSTPTPPPAPSPAAQPTVQLTWNASSSVVVGYRVYRSTTSGNLYSPLFSTPLNALTYNDPTVTSGDTYYYVVTAVDANGVESTYSNQATASVPAS